MSGRLSSVHFLKPFQNLFKASSAVSLVPDNATCESIEAQNGSIKYPYPMRVFLIIGNEFCERFTYYGMVGRFI